MSMDHAADCGKGPIEQQMRRQIGRWTQGAFHQISIQICQHQIAGLQSLIWHAARFDGDQSALAVDAAGIAEGVTDQAPSDEFKVGLQHGGAEGFQTHKTILAKDSRCQPTICSRAEQYRTAEILKETFSTK